jgi:uncharacterized protein YkwD
MALTLALAFAGPAAAQTQTFSGGAPLSFGELQAAPYPSTLDVAGMPGTLTDVNVTLAGVSLTAADLDMLLVSPSGAATLLTSDVPTTLIGSQNWTYDDEAANPQGSDQLTGIFKPTNLAVPSDSDTLPLPAPAEFDGSLLALDGGSPNGTWKLYAADSGLVAPIGSISSWSLQLTTDAVPTPGIAIDPAAIDFGSVAMGTPASRIVTVTNPGSGPLALQLPVFFSPDFTVTTQNIHSPDKPCLLTVGAGDSCKFEVLFTPTAPGAKSAALPLLDDAPGGPHSIALTGTALDVQQQQPQQQPQQQDKPPGSTETGSPQVGVQSVRFDGPTAAGQPTTLHVEASDAKEPVTGLLVDFGEALGLYGASACVDGAKKGNSAVFDVPYRFAKPGAHTVTVTIFAGGCGHATAHTLTFTIDVQTSKAARRMANAADTLVGPDIVSKCKNANLLPSKRKAKVILKALLCVMNEQRKLAKLKPLKISKKLSKAALAHTRSMVAGKFFAHQGPKERSLGPRLKKARYRGAAGENIGAGGGPLGSPLQMVNGWMHSSLHRANLLSRKWKTVGIGFLPAFPIPTSSTPVATFTTDFGVRS